MTSPATRPSKLNPITTFPRSSRFTCRAPCRALSSRAVKRSVNGGCSAPLPVKFSGKRYENGATCAIVATESRLGLVDNLPSLQLWLRARAQWHGIHVRQKKEPVRISECALPGRSTMRLPVSVGTEMRVFASSKRIERVGTPASRRVAKSSLPILASRPVTPSTARKRIRRAIAASVSIVDMAMAPQRFGQHWTNPHSRQQMFALVRIVRHS
jgi:hypothetical protein